MRKGYLTACVLAVLMAGCGQEDNAGSRISAALASDVRPDPAGGIPRPSAAADFMSYTDEERRFALAQGGGVEQTPSQEWDGGVDVSAIDRLIDRPMQALNVDSTLREINDIVASLPQDMAEDFQHATKLLMVTQMKAARFAPYFRNNQQIPDAMLYEHIPGLFEGRTPREIVAEAGRVRADLQADLKSRPQDPFDRMQQQRAEGLGNLPGM